MRCLILWRENFNRETRKYLNTLNDGSHHHYRSWRFFFHSTQFRQMMCTCSVDMVQLISHSSFGYTKAIYPLLLYLESSNVSRRRSAFGIYCHCLYNHRKRIVYTRDASRRNTSEVLNPDTVRDLSKVHTRSGLLSLLLENRTHATLIKLINQSFFYIPKTFAIPHRMLHYIMNY